jgi:hypothetical protein
MNILHLILGVQSPHYTPIENAAKETWLKNPPENIKTIFMYGGSNKIYWDGEESFYVDRPESHYYNICLYKTITAFEWFIESEFDYVYRTSNTGYFDLNEVSKFVQNKPTENFYCGNSQIYERSSNTPTAPYPGINYASGASYFLSKDIVKKIIENKEILYSYNLPGWCDDVSMGKFITEYLKININKDSKRLNVTLDDINQDMDLSQYHYKIEESSLGNSIKNVESIYKIYEFKNKSVGKLS